MTRNDEVAMFRRLDALRQKHRKLDDEISHISKTNPNDQFSLYRLKKEKLGLRDEISGLESTLYPDIIA
jgi:hypothetical protein